MTHRYSNRSESTRLSREARWAGYMPEGTPTTGDELRASGIPPGKFGTLHPTIRPARTEITIPTTTERRPPTRLRVRAARLAKLVNFALPWSFERRRRSCFFVVLQISPDMRIRYRTECSSRLQRCLKPLSVHWPSRGLEATCAESQLFVHLPYHKNSGSPGRCSLSGEWITCFASCRENASSWIHTWQLPTKLSPTAADTTLITESSKAVPK
jgi:hypothetical protein